jgi:NAD(P)-dependent dehydrogenase (short-subunit alcohol dehydrogenase family)
VDVLVNNVGVDGTFRKMSFERWNKVIDTSSTACSTSPSKSSTAC